jgi:hypothetical protein
VPQAFDGKPNSTLEQLKEAGCKVISVRELQKYGAMKQP